MLSNELISGIIWTKTHIVLNDFKKICFSFTRSHFTYTFKKTDLNKPFALLALCSIARTYIHQIPQELDLKPLKLYQKDVKLTNKGFQMENKN